MNQLPTSEIYEKELVLLNSRPLFDIEVSSRCNIRCGFCPRDRMESIGTGLMYDSTICKLINWLPDGASILISGLGEPLLNPDLASFVNKLRRRNLDVSIITNGTLLTPEKFIELRNAGVCEIQISVHSLDKKHYESEIEHSDYNRLMTNLKDICMIDRGTTRLRFNSILELNDKETRDILSFCKENDIVPFLRRKHSRGGSVSRGEIGHTGCGIFPSTYFISYKGEIWRCSNDRFGTPIGNIDIDSFQDVKERKRKYIVDRVTSDACTVCTDTYRWEILESMDVHQIRKTSGERE